MELLPDKDTREGGASAATREESESVNGSGESAEGGVPEGDHQIEETEELLRKAKAMITELREEVPVAQRAASPVPPSFSSTCTHIGSTFHF